MLLSMRSHNNKQSLSVNLQSACLCSSQKNPSGKMKAVFINVTAAVYCLSRPHNLNQPDQSHNQTAPSRHSLSHLLSLIFVYFVYFVYFVVVLLLLLVVRLSSLTLFLFYFYTKQFCSL